MVRTILLVLAAACLAAPDAVRGGGPRIPLPQGGNVNQGARIGYPDNPESPTPGPGSTRQFEDLMNQAQQFFDKGDYYDALDRARQAASLAFEHEQAKQVSAFLTKLNEQGQAQLQGFLQDYDEQNFVKAIKGFGLVSRTFTPLPCAESARKAMDRAKDNPAVTRLIRELKAQDIDAAIDRIAFPPRRSVTTRPAATRPASAGATPASSPSAKAPPAGAPPASASLAGATTTAPSLFGVTSQPASRPSRPDAIRRLPLDSAQQAMTLLQQVVKQYPDTEAGTWAKSDLEVLQADKAFLSALDQHHRTSRAKSLLALAESYLQNGQPQIAAKNYKQVLTEFPHTEWAAKAEVKLEEIKDAQEGK